MGTTAQKLQYLIDAKAGIDTALVAKGITPPTEFGDYGAAIQGIPSGSNKLAEYAGSTIEEITESDLAGITSIKEYAFYGLPSLTSVQIPNGCISISGAAFEACINLTSVSFPDSLQSLRQRVFYGCTNLANIELPSHLTTASGSDTFARCTSITQVTIPGSLKTLPLSMFEGCTSLTTVTFEYGVQNIGQRVFASCPLSHIDLPSSVTSIGSMAFYNTAYSMQYAIIRSVTPPSLPTTSNAFFAPSAYPIYVPAESVDTYKSASGWSAYASRIFAID